MRSNWGRSGVGRDEEHNLWKIIDRIEGGRELTSPSFLGDTLALPDINSHTLPDDPDQEECDISNTDDQVEGKVLDFMKPFYIIIII